MSVRALTEVFRHSTTTLGTRLVLLAIADAAGDDGIAWPSVGNLAEKARMADSSVRRCVAIAADAGELEVWQVRRGRSTINVYRVALGDLDEPSLRRMPTEVAALFAHPPILGGSNSGGSTADPERVTEGVHPPISEDSPADFGRVGADGQQEGKYEPLGNRTNISADEPPSVVKEGGRNVPLDALCEAVLPPILDGSPRLTQAIVALNGRKGQARDGIRAIYWAELVRWAGDDPRRVAQLAEMVERPEVFSDYLVRAIRRRGELFRERMPGISFGPDKLRVWFVDIAREDEEAERGDPFDWGDAA